LHDRAPSVAARQLPRKRGSGVHTATVTPGGTSSREPRDQILKCPRARWRLAAVGRRIGCAVRGRLAEDDSNQIANCFLVKKIQMGSFFQQLRSQWPTSVEVAIRNAVQVERTTPELIENVRHEICGQINSIKVWRTFVALLGLAYLWYDPSIQLGVTIIAWVIWTESRLLNETINQVYTLNSLERRQSTTGLLKKVAKLEINLRKATSGKVTD
jgi:hypothetical protein